MIATNTTIATPHPAKVPPQRQTEIPGQPAFDLSALASVKLQSKLLAVVDETRSDFQNAESDQNLTYLFAICFQKLLNVAQSQFDAEDRVGYLALRSSHLHKQTSKTIAKLNRQHTRLLRTLREMLEMAEAEIVQARKQVNSLGLLNRFLIFQKELRQHERDEQKLLDGLFGDRIQSVS